ncbi:DinB family protein [Streptomyces sp. NPDC091377]|uniref:DinB family protein n=1 Tax=Streptomyces sp. NPDC091377 TaxID=3365995 RepID=UPI0037F6297C
MTTPDPHLHAGAGPRTAPGSPSAPRAVVGPSATSTPQDDLHFYLQSARDALLWKLEGLSEYDIRRPLTPTGTNLLGIVKHVATVELGYLCDTFGRPHGEDLSWVQDAAETNADMWATADETREDVVGLYRRAWAHADATLDALPLNTVGKIPWWPDGKDEVTLHHAVVRVIADTDRHAGHADILRELLDGAAGMSPTNDSLTTSDPAWWQEYRDRLERVAREAAERHA